MPLGAHKAAIMGVSGVSTGDVVLLSSQTADGDSAISFTSGIDSTYGEYIFRFYNINAATDAASFQFQVNAASQSGFNEVLTTTYFSASHTEDGSSSSMSYKANKDHAQGTGDQIIGFSLGSDADTSCAGELHLFNPSSTTYVKHFYTRVSTGHSAVSSVAHLEQIYTAGYFNTTSAIDEVQFEMSSGNFDGKIKMWGVK
jgi:hypothetical protein